MRTSLPRLSIVLAAAVLAIPVLSAALPAHARDPGTAAARKVVYVCPPCGSSCDRDEHDAPGACARCGMALVTKEEAVKALARHANGRASKKRALILVFEGVQIIDFSGPYEVLGQAGLDVATVAEKPGPITTAMGMVVTPAYTFSNAPRPDVIVVPGGSVLGASDSPVVRRWLVESSQKAEITLSVCNGAFILAKAGLLDGLSATTFAPLIEGLKAAAPKAHVVSDKRFVDNGKVITSAGLSSGIDGSLHVVERLFGRGTAQKVATNLEYNWDPTVKYVRAQLADRYLKDVYQSIAGLDGDILLHEGTPDRWENRWIVKSEGSAADLLGVLKGAVKAGGSQRETRGPNGTVNTAWSFTGQNGSAWRGVASVEAVPGQTGRYTLTVRIEKI